MQHKVTRTDFSATEAGPLQGFDPEALMAL
jgi:hypothetical protein